MSTLSRLILHEDEHLLVIEKPAGWNTHAPSPYANEGVYEFLRHREPRWKSLAIIHRLDKETSGILVFTKNPTANKSLTQQFTDRDVHKSYLLLTDRPLPAKSFVVRSKISRQGDRYASSAEGMEAETAFESVSEAEPVKYRGRSCTLLRAHPRTGRTHQIRVHAAERGIPILGDRLYGGTEAERVFLHAERIAFEHPENQKPVEFHKAPQWISEALSRRAWEWGSAPAFLDPEETDCHRLVHGASHGWPGCYVDRLGPYLLAQLEEPLSSELKGELQRHLAESQGTLKGVYQKLLLRRIRGTQPQAVSPELVLGSAAPERFSLLENGMRLEMSFSEGYSVGIFLDQRENRRRWIQRHVAADFPFPEFTASKPELLNTFAYTCGFSVAAALGGWRTTSLDLSKKYLEWGRRNFQLNQLDPAEHDFVFGDTFDWMRRWEKKGRQFDGIILDPPTFSESKEHGRFQAERDFGRLVESALRVLKPHGLLLASTNAARLEPALFVEHVTSAVQRSGRRIARQHFVPQPPDFPITREEPGYLKTIWIQTAP